MTPFIPRFKVAGQAAILALALGAGSLSTMPVQAQSSSFDFRLDLGGDVQTFEHRRGEGRHWDRDFRRDCLTDRQIRRGLGQYGFRDVRIVREFRRDRVQVTGRYGRSSYEMRVDRCTGQVDRVERIRRGGGNAFGLQFEFRN